MKQLLFTLVAVLISMATLNAQQIAVVNGSGSTSVYDTLDEAIEGATSGSTIYLPGGGFRIEKPISKKVTIIGIGYRQLDDVEDGLTQISGDINFQKGSDGSALIGVYAANNVIIGQSENGELAVNNVHIQNCYIGEIYCKREESKNTTINRCIVRGQIRMGNAVAQISNCVMNDFYYCSGSSFTNCIFWSTNRYAYFSSEVSIIGCIFRNTLASYDCGNFHVINCLGISNNDNFGEDCIGFTTEIFKDNKGLNPTTDFHLDGDWKQYESSIGIYAGTGFNDDGLPPMPHIISKNVAEQTDAKGNLRIEVKVKAN